jgi:hypothetical protein
MPDVHVGTGTSEAREAGDAGREAAVRALEGLGAEQPALVLVFTTPRYDLPTLLGSIRSVTGKALVVGATGSGEIVGARHMGFGAGVAVLAMTAGPYRFATASAAGIRGDLDRAGRSIALQAMAEAGESPHAAVIVLADSLVGDLQLLMQGVYRVTGPRVPITGGAAGDEQRFVKTFVFHDGMVVEEGAVALWIASEGPLTVVMRHGWKPMGTPLLVTRVEGTQILDLGGRPAAAVYEEQLGLAPGELGADRFWGTSIRHPLGLLQHDGSTVIRVARSKTERGSLLIQGCVPQVGSAVQVMSGAEDALLEAAEEAAAAALAPRPDAAVLLAFSCAARATILGPRVEEETRRLQAAAGRVPVFGFHCCGEFARTAGVLATHNASLTALAL